MVSIGALLVGVAAAALSYLTLSRAIARPPGEALGHFDAIAAGDLRRPVVVTSRDETGQLLDGIAKMQRSLTETVRTVRSGSESIATATRQIAAGNIDLSSRIEEQASALQETAANMEEPTSTVRQNADNAGRTLRGNFHSRQRVSAGHAAMDEHLVQKDRDCVCISGLFSWCAP